METGHLVRFASQKHPFLVEATPCLDLDGSCSIVTLKLLEVVPPGSAPRDRLTFTLRVCLRTWLEHDPPPRSLEVELRVREFLARFPSERIEELADEFEQARAVERRLKSLSLPGARDELVTYSSVIDEEGGVREGVTEYCFFFVFEGREFLVEDHYGANPECGCQQVHLEFWERAHDFHPKHRINIQQRLMAPFTLTGELTETRFSEECPLPRPSICSKLGFAVAVPTSTHTAAAMNGSRQLASAAFRQRPSLTLVSSSTRRLGRTNALCEWTPNPKYGGTIRVLVAVA